LISILKLSQVNKTGFLVEQISSELEILKEPSLPFKPNSKACSQQQISNSQSENGGETRRNKYCGRGRNSMNPTILNEKIFPSKNQKFLNSIKKEKFNQKTTDGLQSIMQKFQKEKDRVYKLSKH